MRELQRRSATHAANRLLEDVAAELSTIGLETRIVFEALESLCRDSDAALLVLGSTSRSGLAAALHGSLPTRLASTGECPIVAVSPDAAERFLRAQHSGGSVVRGVDDAGESTRALQIAGEMANAA